MATYVLIPGAGGQSWYWHLVSELLRRQRHHVIAPDLPAANESARLHDYVESVVRAIAGHSPDDLIVVGQSMGCLTAPIVCTQVRARLLVLVAPMIPRPGESGFEWWESTGQAEAAAAWAREEGRDPGAFDPVEIFLHDLSGTTRAEALERPVQQCQGPFLDPWPLESWPDIPTRVVACRKDRLFPLAFLRRMSRERLGIEPDVMDTGHLPALADPGALCALFERYRCELGIAS